MDPEIAEMKLGAQQVLDELFSEQLIPFKLTAHAVEPMEHDEYRVRFYDSRLHSVWVSWRPGQSFKVLVRDAILDKVSTLSSSMWDSKAA